MPGHNIHPNDTDRSIFRSVSIEDCPRRFWQLRNLWQCSHMGWDGNFEFWSFAVVVNMIDSVWERLDLFNEVNKVVVIDSFWLDYAEVVVELTVLTDEWYKKEKRSLQMLQFLENIRVFVQFNCSVQFQWVFPGA